MSVNVTVVAFVPALATVTSSGCRSERDLTWRADNEKISRRLYPSQLLLDGFINITSFYVSIIIFYLSQLSCTFHFVVVFLFPLKINIIDLKLKSQSGIIKKSVRVRRACR